MEVQLIARTLGNAKLVPCLESGAALRRFNSFLYVCSWSPLRATSVTFVERKYVKRMARIAPGRPLRNARWYRSEALPVTSCCLTARSSDEAVRPVLNRQPPTSPLPSLRLPIPDISRFIQSSAFEYNIIKLFLVPLSSQGFSHSSQSQLRSSKQ